MQTRQPFQFARIAEAIKFIRENFKQQPDLEQVAKAVHLSPSYFQRLFTDWAGVSPKKFLQYISIAHAKKILTEQQATLSEAANETGLSGTSRLHDLFVNIEGMTPAEYKQGGKNLIINYQFSGSIFGDLIIGSTTKGICYLAFCDEKENALHDLKTKFPNAEFHCRADALQKNALHFFQQGGDKIGKIKLHLKATPFQLKVWECLLKLPMGKLSTYGRIATQTGNPSASRAVGTAIGSNPVAFLIPCHRVIQSTGVFDGYRWGTGRKTAIIGWEQAKTNPQI